MVNPTMWTGIFVYGVLVMNDTVGGSAGVLCVPFLFRGMLRSYSS